tara:strand:+ start:2222 stop:2530 length:309 start_codon:yes stop_codon:yes gene_type:complete
MGWFQDIPTFVAFVLALGWIVSIYFIKREYIRIGERFTEFKDALGEQNKELARNKREMEMDIDELKVSELNNEKFTQQVLHELELLEVELGKKSVQQKRKRS